MCSDSNKQNSKKLKMITLISITKYLMRQLAQSSDRRLGSTICWFCRFPVFFWRTIVMIGTWNVKSTKIRKIKGDIYFEYIYKAKNDELVKFFTWSLILSTQSSDGNIFSSNILHQFIINLFFGFILVSWWPKSRVTRNALSSIATTTRCRGGRYTCTAIILSRTFLNIKN